MAPSARADAAVAAACSLTHALFFRVLGRRVRVDCTSAGIAGTVAANFQALAAEGGDEPADLHYTAHRHGEAGPYVLERPGLPSLTAPDIGTLLFHLEKDLTVTLQRMRPELLFLHAAALAYGDGAWLLAGDSGSGKSTTAWALLHHGLRYLSDELSPIDLQTLRVLPYPHALCLKRRPPEPYPLPPAALDLGDTLHVPAAALPGGVAARPCTVAGLLFVRHRPGLGAPALRPLTPAEACARLYVVTLNALAHPGDGLDAVQHLAEQVPAYALETGELAAACERVGRLLAAADRADGCRPAALPA